MRIDFNRAYNMPCAYTEFATCPVAPAANTLTFAVEAGEQIPADRLSRQATSRRVTSHPASTGVSTR